MNPRKHASTCTASGGFDQRSLLSRNYVLWILVVAVALLFPLLSSGQEKRNPAPPVEPAVDLRILQVKRICFKDFGDDALGRQLKEMVIAKLFEAKRFSLTEKCVRDEFQLLGSVTERNEHTSRSESEGVGFGGVAGARVDVGTGAVAGVTGNAHESLSSSEVKQSAVVTLRIVDKDGEILWAISQESTGGKTKGAIGDAAERAIRQLLRDIERAEKRSEKKESVKQP